MSRVKGTAINGSSEISTLMINGKEAQGAAYGGQTFFTKGSEIYSIISVGSAAAGSPIQITVSCNRLTTYVVTYTVSSSGSLTGVSRNVISYVDTDDGKRRLTFTVTLGTAGRRTLRIFGATTSSSATNHLSVNYIDIPLNVLQA